MFLTNRLENLDYKPAPPQPTPKPHFPRAQPTVKVMKGPRLYYVMIGLHARCFEKKDHPIYCCGSKYFVQCRIGEIIITFAVTHVFPHFNVETQIVGGWRLLWCGLLLLSLYLSSSATLLLLYVCYSLVTLIFGTYMT